MSRLFSKANAAPPPGQALDALNKSRKLVEDRTAHLQRQRNAALAAAQKLVDESDEGRNKAKVRAALHQVKRVKLFDKELETLAAQQLSMVYAINTLEEGILQAETIGAVRQARATLGSMVARTADADEVMADLGQQMADTNTVAEAISSPFETLAASSADDELAAIESELSSLLVAPSTSATTSVASTASAPEPDYSALIAAAARAPETAPARARAVAEYAQ